MTERLSYRAYLPQSGQGLRCGTRCARGVGLDPLVRRIGLRRDDISHAVARLMSLLFGIEHEFFELLVDAEHVQFEPLVEEIG